MEDNVAIRIQLLRRTPKEREEYLIRQVARLLTEKSALLAERDKLRAAIKPFGGLADCIPDTAPDHAMVVLTTLNGGVIDTHARISAGDLRNARAALASEKP